VNLCGYRRSRSRFLQDTALRPCISNRRLSVSRPVIGT
jgi:hypothetical protein